MEFDYTADHHCPVFDEVIDSAVCLEAMAVLEKFIKIEAVPEMAKVKDIEKARKICAHCKYSE